MRVAPVEDNGTDRGAALIFSSPRWTSTGRHLLTSGITSRTRLLPRPGYPRPWSEPQSVMILSSDVHCRAAVVMASLSPRSGARAMVRLPSEDPVDGM